MRFPGVRLVVFDLDGTLIDSSLDLATAVNATLARLYPGATPLDLERVRSFIGDGARALVARSLSAAGLRDRPEDALAVFLDCYRARMLDTTRLYPGVAECLDALGGRPLAVLTNKPGEMSRAILSALGVAGRFFRVIGGDDAPRKPDPAGLLALMREAGVAPAAALMVGDSANDVRTGRAAGAWTVGVRGGFDPAGLAADPPDVLVEGLHELPGLLGGPG
jgi:phosphoglycolate phosphatase